MVVVLCTRAWLRGAERMGVRVPRSTPRLAGTAYETLMGTCAPGGALRVGKLGFLSAVWRDLHCSVHVAGRSDSGTERPCRNRTGGRLSAGSPPGFGQLGVSAAADAVLGELERCGAGRRHRSRRPIRCSCRRGPVDATGADRSVCALSLLCLCRTGLHELPVGCAATGGGIFGHISHQWIPDRRLALPLVGIPLPVSGGHREAALRRSHMAQPDGPRISLLDAAAADPVRVVRRATANLASYRGNSGDFVHRTGQCVFNLPAATTAGRCRLLRAAAAIADLADRQLQFL